MQPQEASNQTTTPPDPMCGAIIDHYLITDRLRDGIGGTLYVAVHPALGKKAAIKITHKDTSKDPKEEEYLAERFLAEGRAAAQIDHANVVSVFNFGRMDDGR